MDSKLFQCAWASYTHVGVDKAPLVELLRARKVRLVALNHVSRRMLRLHGTARADMQDVVLRVIYHSGRFVLKTTVLQVMVPHSMVSGSVVRYTTIR